MQFKKVIFFSTSFFALLGCFCSSSYSVQFFSSSISVFLIHSIANVICMAHDFKTTAQSSIWHTWGGVPPIIASLLTVQALFGISVNHTNYSSCNGWPYELYFKCRWDFCILLSFCVTLKHFNVWLFCIWSWIRHFLHLIVNFYKWTITHIFLASVGLAQACLNY